MKQLFMVLSLAFTLSALANERCEEIRVVDFSEVMMKATCGEIKSAMFEISENILPDYELINVEPMYPHLEKSVLMGICRLCYSKN